MSVKKKKLKKLGTGLSSLLTKDEELDSIIRKPGRPPKKTEAGDFKKNLKTYLFKAKDSTSQTSVVTHLLVPGKYQPRKSFNNKEIEELAESIKQNGILQPILVRPMNTQGKTFEIVAGERRWRAAQIAKLHEVPVIIRNFDDETALGVGLVENLQRTDLNLLEEAEGYKMLMKKFEYTQEKLSSYLGKSRSHIANILRLLNLPSTLKTYLVVGDLSYGHIRAIATLSENKTNEIISQIIEKKLSVRETEKLVKKAKKNVNLNFTANSEPDPNIEALERELTNLLGLKVVINNNAKNKGSLSIQYSSLDQLEPIIDKLKWRPK